MKLSKLRALVAAVVPAVAAAVSQFRCGHCRIMSFFTLLDRFKDKIELASSGPYGPFLAIHRAFYNKMSVGKCYGKLDATE